MLLLSIAFSHQARLHADKVGLPLTSAPGHRDPSASLVGLDGGIYHLLNDKAVVKTRNHGSIFQNTIDKQAIANCLAGEYLTPLGDKRLVPVHSSPNGIGNREFSIGLCCNFGRQRLVS